MGAVEGADAEVDDADARARIQRRPGGAAQGGGGEARGHGWHPSTAARADTVPVLGVSG